MSNPRSDTTHDPAATPPAAATQSKRSAEAMTESTTGTGRPADPVGQQAAMLADYAPAVSDLRSIERASRWVQYADEFLAFPADHPTFTVADVEKIETCPPEFRERARDLVGRDGFPIAIGRTLTP